MAGGIFVYEVSMLSLSRFLPRLMLSGLLLSAAALPAFSGEARVLVDMTTGTVLEQENADALNYPASLTKMMTLYLTFEALHNGRLTWDTRITMSENANGKEPFKFAIGAGKTVSVREAVTGMIVLSANDAAVAYRGRMGYNNRAAAIVWSAWCWAARRRRPAMRR